MKRQMRKGGGRGSRAHRVYLSRERDLHRDLVAATLPPCATPRLAPIRRKKSQYSTHSPSYKGNTYIYIVANKIRRRCGESEGDEYVLDEFGSLVYLS